MHITVEQMLICQIVLLEQQMEYAQNNFEDSKFDEPDCKAMMTLSLYYLGQLKKSMTQLLAEPKNVCY